MFELAFLWKVHSWYPPQCCGGNDCEAAEEIEHRPEGTMLKSRGQWWNEKRAKQRHPSPDGRWHICIFDYGDGKGPQVVCVFVPAGT